MKPKRPMLDYYGGKWRIAPRIIELLPEHTTFVDAMAGAGSLLMRKPKVKNEIVNDVHDEIVNLFEVLRNDAMILKQLLINTPYARAEYHRARDPHFDNIEQARRTIVKSWFGISDSLDSASGFRVSLTQAGSMTRAWVDYVDFLEAYRSRLRTVIIENLDYRDLLKRYDKPGTLFYLDPPYVKATRTKKNAYKHNWSDADHIELLEILKTVKCKVAVSGYNSEIYSDLCGFEKHEMPARTQKRAATEVLWVKASDEHE